MLPRQQFRPPQSIRRQPPATSATPISRRRLWQFLAVIVIGLCCLHGLQPHRTSADQQQHVRSVKQTTPLSQAATNTLDDAMDHVIEANPNVDISISITDLNTGTRHDYGPDVPYDAASVAKLITAVDYAQQVEHGKQAWGTTLEDGSTAAADYRKMVVNSDNGAWQSLNDRLSLNSLSTTAQSIGITDYNLDNNSLTTDDIATLLQKLYQGKLLNQADTKLLLGDMKIANENYLIPPAVPKGVTVYHKAGLLEDRVHDAAIIDNGSRPIIVIIFTNGHGTYDFPGRTAAIQTITKAALTAYGIK